MENEYLSTGFTNVDRVQNKDAYYDCLTLLDSLPYYQECKSKSYDLLKLKAGQTVLDAGCGLGDDAFRMARRIVPGGRVVGLDVSEAMIEKAKMRALSEQLPVEFMLADIKALPFPYNSFSCCRTDRVLQHIQDPKQAIAELVRVLEPGGRLLAYDNDWSSFSIKSGNLSISRIIERFWCNSFTNSLIGRQLPAYFIDTGLSDVISYPGTSVIADFETADKVYNLRQTVQKAVEKKYLSASEGPKWIDELVTETVKGRFTVMLKAYTVVGKK